MEDPIAYPNEVGLPIPPLDHDFFPENFPDDVNADDFPFGVDFDFTFDDLSFADNLLLEPDPCPEPDPPGSDLSQVRTNPNSDNSDNNNQSVDEIRVYDCSSPDQNHGPISSQESNFADKSSCHSPESGSCKSNSGVYSGNSSDRDVSSSSLANNNHNLSPSPNHNSVNLSDDDDNNKRKVKVEDVLENNNGKKCTAKRKKELPENEHDEVRTSKFRRSSSTADGEGESLNLGGDEDEDERRKARLMRNRESAQLSRQRKKQYVEELEDKVRSMHSTITDLNSRISYIMAENVSLRQQLSGGGGVPPMPPPHGMYHPPIGPMPYPWMPCAPYMVKHQGSHVPLVPIPRLKPQQPAPASKVNKRSEGKKSEGKTKKVASVSLFGLLFFFMLFGGLVPMVNVRYGGIVGDLQKGTVFMVEKHVGRVGVSEGRFGHGRILQQSNSSDGGNSTEPLVASLYVPRNDKMVKIDGNLIIHSVLASEKAMASETAMGAKTSEETSLAIHGSYPPYPTPGPGSNSWRHPHLDRNHNGRQRALGSGSADEFTPVGSDGQLQQWFREGLAGPMLSSGMCTEVFQFDVSPAQGSIVPATSIANITSEDSQNSTRLNKTTNRRILHGHAIPFNDHKLNASEEHMQAHEQNDGLQGNKSRSSVVVSVLVDPREVGDGDGEGVMGSKTLSRIFVVVLIDSVKYVTYSCMLPFMGSGSHVVTA